MQQRICANEDVIPTFFLEWLKLASSSADESKLNGTVCLFFKGAQQPEGEAAEPDPWIHWTQRVGTFSSLSLFVCWRLFFFGLSVDII